MFSGNLDEMREWKKGKGKQDSKQKKREKKQVDKLTLKERELESQLNPNREKDEDFFSIQSEDSNEENEEMAPKFDMESFYRGVDSDEEYIDSDSDDFFDRTSQAKNRKLKRKQQTSGTSQKVETYSTLIEKKEKLIAQRDSGLREIARISRENYGLKAYQSKSE